MELDYKLKGLFCLWDYIYPPMIFEENIWKYRCEVLEKDFEINTKWSKFTDNFNVEFGGNIMNLEKHVENVLSEIKKSLNSNKKFEKVISQQPSPNITNIIKKQESLWIGHTYLSIDLYRACNQALEFKDCLNGKTWDDFLKDFTDSNLIKDSKWIRVNVIPNEDLIDFKVNFHPLLDKILESNHPIINKLNELNCCIVSFKDDELVYDITGYENEFSQISEKILYCINGIYVHIKQWKFDSMLYEIGSTIKTLGIHKSTQSNAQSYTGVRGNIYFQQAFCAYNGLTPHWSDSLYPLEDGYGEGDLIIIV